MAKPSNKTSTPKAYLQQEIRRDQCCVVHTCIAAAKVLCPARPAVCTRTCTLWVQIYSHFVAQTSHPHLRAVAVFRTRVLLRQLRAR